MWLSASGILVLFLYVNPTLSREACPDNVIKEAIISLAHIMRENSQKLERHEGRERQLGEWMKKAVGALSKKVTGLDTLKPQLSQIEERMTGIEQLISQRDERERIQIQKTANSIENLESRLGTQIKQINSMLYEVSRSVEAIPPTATVESIASNIIARLNETETHFGQQIATIEFGLDTMARKNEAEATNRAQTLESLSAERDQRDRRQIEKTTDLINNLEKRLGAQIEGINSTISEVGKCDQPTTPTPTAESATSEIIVKLRETEAQIAGQIARIEFSLNSMGTNNDAEAKKQTKALETLSQERDEREEKQFNKTVNLIEDLEKHLEAQIDKINSTISEVGRCDQPTPPTLTAEALTSEIISKLNETEARFAGQMAIIDFDLKTMTTKNADDAAAIDTVFSKVQNISSIIMDIEESLEKLNEAVKKGENKTAEEAIDVAAMIEEQNKALNKVTELLEDTANRVQELPTQLDVETFHNETQAALQETKTALEDAMSNGTSEVIDQVDENGKTLKKSVEALRLDLANNAQHVNEELQKMIQAQIVMVTIADDVIAIKKNVEFGIRQIISVLGETIKENTALINRTLHDKFDVVSSDIMNNQGNAFANLNTKMEQKIAEVWRQLSLTNQKMTESVTTLDELRRQNQAYINDTTSTMDGMKTKVGDIIMRVNEVDQTLNASMGQLSLTTQQFNRIKSVFQETLDSIRSSFKGILQKASDISDRGPNPYPVDSPYFSESRNEESKNSELSKTGNTLIDPPAN